MTKLEAEASQARNEARVQAQQAAAESAALRVKDLEAAQEMETRAMERCVCVGGWVCAARMQGAGLPYLLQIGYAYYISFESYRCCCAKSCHVRRVSAVLVDTRVIIGYVC